MCGCGSDVQVVQNDLDKLLSDIDAIASTHPNNSLTYFDYYLPSDMGEISFDKESLVLKYLDNKVIVNVNVIDIVNKQYYPDEYLASSLNFDKNNIFYSKTGHYTTIKNADKDYILSIYQNGDEYIVELVTSDLTYITSTKSYIKDLVKHLFTIAKSVDLEQELVINDYSDKNIVDYKKSPIDLFDSTKPTNGDLSELLIGDAVIGNQGPDEPIEDDTDQDAEEIIENENETEVNDEN